MFLKTLFLFFFIAKGRINRILTGDQRKLTVGDSQTSLPPLVAAIDSTGRRLSEVSAPSLHNELDRSSTKIREAFNIVAYPRHSRMRVRIHILKNALDNLSIFSNSFVNAILDNPSPNAQRRQEFSFLQEDYNRVMSVFGNIKSSLAGEINQQTAQFGGTDQTRMVQRYLSKFNQTRTLLDTLDERFKSDLVPAWKAFHTAWQNMSSAPTTTPPPAATTVAPSSCSSPSVDAPWSVNDRVNSESAAITAGHLCNIGHSSTLLLYDELAWVIVSRAEILQNSAHLNEREKDNLRSDAKKLKSHIEGLINEARTVSQGFSRGCINEEACGNAVRTFTENMRNMRTHDQGLRTLQKDILKYFIWSQDVDGRGNTLRLRSLYREVRRLLRRGLNDWEAMVGAFPPVTTTTTAPVTPAAAPVTTAAVESWSVNDDRVNSAFASTAARHIREFSELPILASSSTAVENYLKRASGSSKSTAQAMKENFQGLISKANEVSEAFAGAVDEETTKEAVRSLHGKVDALKTHMSTLRQLLEPLKSAAIWEGNLQGIRLYMKIRDNIKKINNNAVFKTVKCEFRIMVSAFGIGNPNLDFCNNWLNSRSR